jgi:ribonuclease G
VSLEIICNKTGREVRVALLEDGRLTELHIDRGDARGYVGNVYLGRVVRVLPGMQAAFVEVGLERAGFLYVGDISKDHVGVRPTEEGVELDASGSKAKPKPGHPAIQDLIQEGQLLLVQVAKDPIGTKGARLTTHIALPGRYMVLMPTVEHIGISRKIDSDKERKRLRECVRKSRVKGAGYIVRTVCEGRTVDTLKADMDFLHKTWEQIQEGAKERKGPALLRSEYGLLLRSVRDLFGSDVSRLILDDRKLFDEVQTFMDEFLPKSKDKVHLYRGADPIFDTYGVEGEVRRCLGRKVWLKSGGYLVIDQTEALMAIDVNSGRYVGGASLEDTTTTINLEAAIEVAAQLRLRNMGGIIIIDFIDMERASSREKVYNTLYAELKLDRARTNVQKISEFGLVEMTRKRVQEGLDRYLSEDCSTCQGTGVIRAGATLVYDILREAKREAKRHPKHDQVLVNTTPAIADLIYGDHFDDLESMERSLGKQIVVRALPHLHPEKYEVYTH